MFKRPRLRATHRLVNESPLLALLFLAAACSGPVETTDPAPETAPDPVVETGLSLPAVWSTNRLGSAIADVAVAGEFGSTVAVTFEDGGLQFFNFDAELITEKADLGAAKVGNGRYLLLSGVPVTIFPGTDQDGAMKLFIHGGQLTEPLVYDLDTGVEGSVSGLCTAAPKTDADGVMQLAFWTEEAPDELNSGRLVEVGEELAFLPDEPVQSERAITACLLGDSGATVYSAPALAAVELERRGRITTLLLDTSGNYTVVGADNDTEPLTIRDGISIRTPRLPMDMAGTGDARGGGYPGGLVVIGGEDSNGEHRIIFIDPSDLTLAELE